MFFSSITVKGNDFFYIYMEVLSSVIRLTATTIPTTTEMECIVAFPR